jgi:NAD(P)-dependent dehydrogenase (short-subunit alcohol dehydrogenase family)
MPRALIIGGTSLIGRATTARLLAAGWQVDLTGRDPARLPAHLAAAGGRFVPADREDAAQLAAAFGDGADLLVDCLCYTAVHARMLLPLARHTASTVMISAKRCMSTPPATTPTPPPHHTSTAPSPNSSPP